MARPKKIVVAQIVFDRLPELRGLLRQRADLAIRKAALDIQMQAQATVPVRYGYLKNSIHIVTHDSSGHAQAQAEARAANPQERMLPEVARPGELQAVVAVGAEYGVYVEMGTRHQAARPYLGPAAERIFPALKAAMAQLLR